MANKGRSEPDIFGGYTHYDENGKKTGKSEPRLLGGYTHYDANGRKTGHSDPKLTGGYTHYGSDGKKTGSSDIKVTGGYVHYDAKGKKTGESDPKMLGGFSHSSGSDGCYIATCVYGSYDCPEVRTLRRFRDGYLRRSLPGRMFIGIYYRLSPGVVARFGGSGPFRRMTRSILDRFVSSLRSRGYADTPYTDRNVEGRDNT